MINHSNSVEGLWTIRWQPYTAGQHGGWRLEAPGVELPPWPGEEPLPVVPCDDYAVEKVAQALYDSDDERIRADGVEWVNEPDGYKGLWRDRARDVLRAAMVRP